MRLSSKDILRALDCARNIQAGDATMLRTRRLAAAEALASFLHPLDNPAQSRFIERAMAGLDKKREFILRISRGRNPLYLCKGPSGACSFGCRPNVDLHLLRFDSAEQALAWAREPGNDFADVQVTAEELT